MTEDPLIIPLLRDWHNHPLLYAAIDAGIDLNEGGTHSEQGADELRDRAVRRIREHVQLAARGWTFARGWNSGRYSLAKREFDDLPPLVVLNLSLHDFIVNDTGRALLKEHDREVVDNLDNQQWIERNLRRILNVFANYGASADRLRDFYRRLLEEHGIYHAEEMLLVDEREIGLFEEAGLNARSRFWAAPQQYDALPSDLQKKVHGIKLFTDGALGAWTAALHRPFRELPAHADWDPRGMLMHEPNELEGILRRCLDAGKPVALHAIGDRAIDQVVAAVETVGAPAQGTIRIEHAQLISKPTARRAKALGVHLCMQPNFSDDSVYYARRLPEGYPERNNPFRMLIDEVGYVPGEDLLFGSDGMPHGFREGLRQSLFPHYETQRLSVPEFVAGYCLPEDESRRTGHIEVRIDPDKKSVSGHVVLG
jgi:predicted amidohydrolase YtcJ